MSIGTNYVGRILKIINEDGRFTVDHIKDLQDKKLLYIKDANIREKIKPFIHYDKIDDDKINTIKDLIALDHVHHHNYKNDIRHYIYGHYIIEMIGFIIQNHALEKKDYKFSFFSYYKQIMESPYRIKQR